MTRGEAFRAKFLAQVEVELAGAVDEELLDDACARMDELEVLERVLADEGPSSVGSTGQPTAHWALRAIREHQKTIQQLLRELDPEGQKLERQRRARKASAAAQQARTATQQGRRAFVPRKAPR